MVKSRYILLIKPYAASVERSVTQNEGKVSLTVISCSKILNIDWLQRNVGKHESFMEKIYGAVNKWYVYHHPHTIKLLIWISYSVSRETDLGIQHI
jgi:DNA relaxase NicK